MKISKIDGPDNIQGGDYGVVLQSGIVLGTNEDVVLYGRTGPYVPSISFPSSYRTIVIDSFKSLLERSGLSGFAFKVAILKKCVIVDWKSWDSNNWKYPSDVGAGENNEPGDYIKAGNHSKELADRLGKIWELVFKEATPGTQYNFFRLSESNYRYVDQAGRAWLEKHCPGEVGFREELEHKYP
jgi:hypothetical protein